jgi:lysophospholipase L1-like esterase
MRMTTQSTTFSAIKAEISNKQDMINKIQSARMAIQGYRTIASPMFTADIEALLPEGHRQFNLLAQGDSWFDYSPGTDLIHCLHEKHGHKIDNIAVAGSTLNDEAYGPVPRELFGIPNVGPTQTNDPSRIAELVHRIQQNKPDALLLSAGGNDVAGQEFFTFINNAQSGLESVNEAVLTGAVNTTFKAAYKFIITNALQAAAEVNINMPIFLHGYDYPWPDGRGLLNFIGWKIGPWFDDTFNHKNYPNRNSDDLTIRFNILKKFINEINIMQQSLMQEYPNQVYHVDLRNTLSTVNDWSNELHPGNDGFAQLAAKIDAALQANVTLTGQSSGVSKLDASTLN